MCEVNEPTTKCMLNDVLKEVFQELHSTVVDTINTTAVVDRLFSDKVLGASDLHDLELITHRLDKCRRLLVLLHKSKHPSAFMHLRRAIQYEAAHEWLIAEIDHRYETLTAVKAKTSEVRAVSDSLQPANTYDGVSDASLLAVARAENDKLRKENLELKHQIEHFQRERLRYECEIQRYRQFASDGAWRKHSPDQFDKSNRTCRFVAEQNRMTCTNPDQPNVGNANLYGNENTTRGTSKVAGPNGSDHQHQGRFESAIRGDEETHDTVLCYRQSSDTPPLGRFDDDNDVRRRADFSMRELAHETDHVLRVRTVETERPDEHESKSIHAANGSREKPIPVTTNSLLNGVHGKFRSVQRWLHFIPFGKHPRC